LGALWHLDGEQRQRRNEILRARDTRDYSFVDWLSSVTALIPAEEPPLFQIIPLDTPVTAGGAEGLPSHPALLTAP
jgi:salicylate hydroxylase